MKRRFWNVQTAVQSLRREGFKPDYQEDPPVWKKVKDHGIIVARTERKESGVVIITYTKKED